MSHNLHPTNCLPSSSSAWASLEWPLLLIAPHRLHGGLRCTPKDLLCAFATHASIFPKSWLQRAGTVMQEALFCTFGSAFFLSEESSSHLSTLRSVRWTDSFVKCSRLWSIVYLLWWSFGLCLAVDFHKWNSKIGVAQPAFSFPGSKYLGMELFICQSYDCESSCTRLCSQPFCVFYTVTSTWCE